MTSAEFEKVYEKTYAAAVRLARSICGADAEDAVQNAAIYFVERLPQYERITPALFLYQVTRRAQHYLPASERNPKNRQEFIFSAGLQDELALLEKEQMPESGRRNPPGPRAE